MALDRPPLFAALDASERVLIAGAGGGFDVYAGLPLALSLLRLGKRVDLANLSFSDLDYVQEDRWLAEGVARVDSETDGSDVYFPERTLARWMLGEDLPIDVYAIRRAGVRPVAAAYRSLKDRLEPDALVLIDGGTDILLHGDEDGLGTPEEDVTSLLAAHRLDVPTKLVASLGFGIDTFHGVCHAHVLENLAGLARQGAYLGALSIPPDSPEASAYVDAVRHAALHTHHRPSIVNGQIAAAIEGRFGDVQISSRTAGGELFVNPLMAVYFTVRLDALAERLLYAEALAETDTMPEVTLAIERFRATHSARPYRSIPH